MPLPFNLISSKPFEDYTAEEFQAGQVLFVDKPLAWTSFQVVNKLKHFIRRKHKLRKIKIGHAGTLDPLATGLLIICTGKMTKSIETFQGLEKAYSGTFLLGATTPSYDLETEIDEKYSLADLTQDKIDQAVEKLTGEIEQFPPIYSAVKIDGRRAYKLARNGQEVEVRPRIVEIRTFEIDTKDFPKIHFKIICSKGTYIRSIAHDLGKLLHNGAHLIALRRERIGEFLVPDSGA